VFAEAAFIAARNKIIIIAVVVFSEFVLLVCSCVIFECVRLYCLEKSVNSPSRVGTDTASASWLVSKTELSSYISRLVPCTLSFDNTIKQTMSMNESL